MGFTLQQTNIDKQTMWDAFMRQYLEHPVLCRVNGLFRKQFEESLEKNLPEAHYLEGLRYAVWEKNIVMAKKHMFKAVNHIDEVVFVMAMLAICAGEKKVGEFFTEHLQSLLWGEVLARGTPFSHCLSEWAPGMGQHTYRHGMESCQTAQRFTTSSTVAKNAIYFGVQRSFVDAVNRGKPEVVVKRFRNIFAFL